MKKLRFDLVVTLAVMTFVNVIIFKSTLFGTEFLVYSILTCLFYLLAVFPFDLLKYYATVIGRRSVKTAISNINYDLTTCVVNISDVEDELNYNFELLDAYDRLLNIQKTRVVRKYLTK